MRWWIAAFLLLATLISYIDRLTLARLLDDPVWWLFLVWLPLNLSRARNLDLKEIRVSVWVPFLFADIGALSGGWFSGWLIRHGRKPVRARIIAIVLGAALTPAGTLVFSVRSKITVIALINAVLFAFRFWINNVQTLATDFFPNKVVASVSGLAGRRRHWRHNLHSLHRIGR